MKLEKKELPLIALIILMFLVSLYLYSKMPERMPIHWNAKGEIDGYGNRFIGLFLMPIFLAGIYLLFLFLPKIMVYEKINKLIFSSLAKFSLRSNFVNYQKNFEKFKKYFYGFKVIFILFFVIIYMAALLPNFGIIFNIGYIMIPALSVLFFYVGYMLKYAKRNYFIGIRTPWTLASENVWNKTHQLGSKLFMIFALIMLSALFFPGKMLWFILVPLILLVIFLFVYSYLEYKKEVKK